MLEFFSIDATGLDGGTLLTLVITIGVVSLITRFGPGFEWHERVRRDAETYARLKEVAGDSPTDRERQVLQDLREEMFVHAHNGMRANPWLVSLALDVALMLEIAMLLIALTVTVIVILCSGSSGDEAFVQFLFRTMPVFVCISVAWTAGLFVMLDLYYDALYKWEHWQAERSQARGDEEPDEWEQNHKADGPEVHAAPPMRKGGPHKNTPARDARRGSARRQRESEHVRRFDRRR